MDPGRIVYPCICNNFNTGPHWKRDKYNVGSLSENLCCFYWSYNVCISHLLHCCSYYLCNYSNLFKCYLGATGSGKTTQVPQYILDEYAKDQRYCNIIVTQPRRIAAISISKRVCQERGWTQGSLVGYQVGRDSCVSEDTRLSYVTTGTLLQKLIHSKNMNQYTHVILDEVRMGSCQSDTWQIFCLLIWSVCQDSNVSDTTVSWEWIVLSDYWIHR